MNKEEIKRTLKIIKYAEEQEWKNLYRYIIDLQNQAEKLTQENNDLEERVIHQDNVINHLETWIKKQIEECNNYSKYIEKKVSELKARSSGKTYIANEIMKNEVAKKVIQEFLDKLNELRGKNE